MCVKFSPENLNPGPYSSHSTSTYTWWGYLINGYLCMLNELTRIKQKINPKMSTSSLKFKRLVISNWLYYKFISQFTTSSLSPGLKEILSQLLLLYLPSLSPPILTSFWSPHSQTRLYSTFINLPLPKLSFTHIMKLLQLL